ncbi:Putative XPG/Rad2 endonuclease, XPG-I domain, PIN-like domain superfamily [Septoria linicola]|uniref:XPG/Rad2 endonuclease, XPG-I domain, PIN-like domain superfamily n=1 Tax=Septoria linicola TaxID=215465 RepID=A0A9Q9AZX3_9PEZI|nr:Putative XPG/Rad2 endonuclease, XPG-I domain, PIN-like domain superfamily [Septoria linicola]
MGITGLWQAVEATGVSKSTTLTRESEKCLTEKGRPLRVAVDASIVLWKLICATKNAATHGGMNHPSRTFMTRVLNDMQEGVQALYVFDGPGRPNMKRNQRRPNPQPAPAYVPNGDPGQRSPKDIEIEYSWGHVTESAKKILDVLNVPRWDAPGEAEAECVALEKAGIVDAVMTTDGDALAFGGRHILREGRDKQGRTLTSVRLEDLEAAGLKGSSCSLLALLSGGDYHDGLRNCGPKIALRIAKESAAAVTLQNMVRSKAPPKAKQGMLDGWRRSQRAAFVEQVRAISNAVVVALPADFPNAKLLAIWTLYLLPKVSELDVLRDTLPDVWQPRSAPALELREFTARYFGWQGQERAKQFLSRTTPGLLAQQLLNAGQQKIDKSILIVKVKKKQERGSKEGEKVQIVKVHYQPLAIAPIDYLAEPRLPGFEWKPGADGKHDPYTPYVEEYPTMLLRYGAPSCLADLPQSASKTKRPAEQLATPAAKKMKMSASNTAAFSNQKAPRSELIKQRCEAQSNNITKVGQPLVSDTPLPVEVLDLTQM